MTDLIRYETDGAVGIVTINRPEKRNAMTYAMLGEFLERVAEAGADESTRALIITGAPGAFCAGTDLADLATVPGAQRGLRGGSEERGRWWPIVECPKPVVGAIDGPAVGMGAEFSSQCDIRIASPNARFAWNFVHRGLVPDTGAGSWLLPRLIGTQRALKLLYTGDFLTAEEALADRLRRSGGAERGPAGYRTGAREQHRRRLAVLAEPDQVDGVRRTRRRSVASTCSATRRRWPSVSSPTTTKRVLPRSSNGALRDSPVPEEARHDHDHFEQRRQQGQRPARRRGPVADAHSSSKP